MDGNHMPHVFAQLLWRQIDHVVVDAVEVGPLKNVANLTFKHLYYGGDGGPLIAEILQPDRHPVSAPVFPFDDLLDRTVRAFIYVG